MSRRSADLVAGLNSLQARRTVLLACIVLQLVTGCAGHASSAASADAGRLQALFDCYRVQSAWGYLVSGWLITAEGEVYQYRYRGVPLPGIGDRRSDRTLLERKWHDRHRVGSVPRDELQVHFAQVEAAARGSIVRRSTGSRDAGHSLCVAMQWRGDGYNHVVLGSLPPSDIEVVNVAPAGTALRDWLSEISNRPWRVAE